MKIVAMVVVVLLGVVAMAAPDPALPQPEAQAGREAPPVAVCALQEGSGRSTRVSVLSTVDGPGTLTAFAGGAVSATEEFQTGPSGSEVIEVVDVAAVGTVGSLVDLPVVSSAVGTVVTGAESLAVETCAATPQPQTFITGGSTISGLSFDLHLMNPYAGEAIVRLIVRSEVGLEASERLDALVIPARTSTIIDFSQVLSGREELSITIETEEGNVIAVGRQRKEGDGALWNAVAGAQDWFIPVPQGGEVKTLFIGTPSNAEVDFWIDLYGPEGLEEAYQSGTIEPRGRVGLDLAAITEEAIGIKVLATGPVVPTLWIDTESGMAATTGLTEPATGWLLPGAGTLDEGLATLVVMNPGIEDTTVSLRPLGGDGLVTEIDLPAETVIEIELGLAHGYLLESADPTVALWVTQREGSAAVSAGVPIPDG